MICQTGGRSTQRGFGALVMMMGVLVLGASSVGVLFYNPRAANAVDERKTSEALATAKDALIVYAARRGDPSTSGTARPGELPCPDTNNDGVEESSCSAGAIGRLPWKTLGIADVGLNRGRFPSQAYPENWGQGTIPVLPAWITANDWQNLVYYAVGRQQTAGGGAGCYFCSAAQTVTVDGQPVSALVFTPGLPPPGIDRSSPANRNNLAYYLEDAPNQDGDDVICPGASTENANKILKGIPPLVPLHCDAYAKPTSKAYDRDRIYTGHHDAGGVMIHRGAALVRRHHDPPRAVT